MLSRVLIRLACDGCDCKVLFFLTHRITSLFFFVTKHGPISQSYCFKQLDEVAGPVLAAMIGADFNRKVKSYILTHSIHFHSCDLIQHTDKKRNEEHN